MWDTQITSPPPSHPPLMRPLKWQYPNKCLPQQRLLVKKKLVQTCFNRRTHAKVAISTDLFRTTSVRLLLDEFELWRLASMSLTGVSQILVERALWNYCGFIFRSSAVNSLFLNINKAVPLSVIRLDFASGSELLRPLETQPAKTEDMEWVEK